MGKEVAESIPTVNPKRIENQANRRAPGSARLPVLLALQPPPRDASIYQENEPELKSSTRLVVAAADLQRRMYIVCCPRHSDCAASDRARSAEPDTADGEEKQS